MEKKVHAVKCASHTHKYNGDMRNISFYANQMEECNCDGYHTFNELYDHRITLYIALCKKLNSEDDTNKSLKAFKEGFAFDVKGWIRKIWRSKKHSDGELCFGTGTQFILGINKGKGEQISYHIPIERWNETVFAETLEKAPEFDGHTSDDVLERLKKI